WGARVVAGERPGQAAAVNAGMRAATGDLLAVLEDDDFWQRRKMEVQLEALRARRARHRFVSSNQLEVSPAGIHERVNDFPTPSGWLMDRGAWEAVGPLDESFQFHLDNEWLGRLRASDVQRLHLYEKVRPVREALLIVARQSCIQETG